jgi:hypothetical protein
MGWKKFLIIVGGMAVIIGLGWSIVQIMVEISGNCILLQLTMTEWMKDKLEEGI